LPDNYVRTLRSLAEANRRGEAVEYFWRVALRMPEQAISGCNVVADVAPPGVDGPHALV